MTSRTVKLGEVCATVSGGTPPRTKYECFGGDIPWVKINDMLQGLVTETEETLTSEGLASCSAKLLPAGTVLISVFATIGRTAILGVPAATNQAIAGVVPNDAESLDPALLRYFLDSKRHELIRAARGVAQPNINQSILRDLDLPLLPITEQRRIVDLLARAEGIVRLRREAQQKAAELIPGELSEVRSARPGASRSSNFALPTEFSDEAKHEFAEQTFAYVKDYFRGSLDELQRRNPGYSGKLRDKSAVAFTAVVFKNGQRVAGCYIRLGGMMSSNGIAYSGNENSSDNSYNEILDIQNDKHILLWRAQMGAFSGRDPAKGLSQEGAAEHLWSMLIAPLR